jgi:hypothetical protein
MATQYELLLLQNIAGSGEDFAEKRVVLGKGALLSGGADHFPAVLAAGPDGGYHLEPDSNEASGMKWVANAGAHTQGTDTGTTNNTFAVDSDSVLGKIIFDVALGAANKSMTITNEVLTEDVVITYPAETGTLATKAYADGLFAANDALLFKGTVGSGGTLEIAAFNSLAAYNAGWTYRVITAGTIKGKACRVGDMIVATVDRSGSGNVDGDWTNEPTNNDGMVIGPTSATDGVMALFDSTSGKLLKAGAAPHVAATVTTTNGLSISGQEISLQLADASHHGALSDTDWSTFNGKLDGLVSAPATSTSAGVAGHMAFDSNYGYKVTATNTWRRWPMASWA